MLSKLTIDKAVPKLVPCVALVNVCKRLLPERSELNGLVRELMTIEKKLD